MSDTSENFIWQDEAGEKITCTEKIRLLKENETEFAQMAEDMFEDGIAMGVSKTCMSAAMKNLLRRLASGFSLAFLIAAPLFAQADPQNPEANSIISETTDPPQAAAPLGVPLPELPTPQAPPALPAPPQTAGTQDAAAVPAADDGPKPPALPMRAVPQTPPVFISGPLLYPAASWEGRSIGVIRILDRVTSETKLLEIPVGSDVTFHRLTIALHKCLQKPEGLPADTAIRLGLSEIPLKDESASLQPLQRQFEGWFLAAEPAANIYPSPLYNIQAVRCAGNPVPPLLPSLLPQAQPSEAGLPQNVLPNNSEAPKLPLVSGQASNSPSQGAIPVLDEPPVKIQEGNLPFSGGDSGKKAKKEKQRHYKRGQPIENDLPSIPLPP